MFLISKAWVEGNLTHDAEWKQFSEDRGVLTFSVAINHTVRAGTDEQRNLVGFLKCKMFFNKRPDWASKYVKGQCVSAAGQLVPENWTDSNGKARSILVLQVEQCHMINIPKSDDAPRTKEKPKAATPSTEEIVKAVLAAMQVRGKEAAKVSQASALVEEGEPDTTVEVGEIAF